MIVFEQWVRNLGDVARRYTDTQLHQLYAETIELVRILRPVLRKQEERAIQQTWEGIDSAQPFDFAPLVREFGVHMPRRSQEAITPAQVSSERSSPKRVV